MGSTLFPTINANEHEIESGFLFQVIPTDETNEQDLEYAASAEEILNSNWEDEASSELTVDDVVSDASEDADLLYLDAVTILTEHQHELAQQLVINSVVVVGGLAVVVCAFADEDDIAGTVDESDFD